MSTTTTPPSWVSAAREKITKHAATQTKDDQAIAEAFAQQAYTAVGNRDRRIMCDPYLLGFEIVDKNEDNNRLVGVFAFRVSGEILMVPVFFLNGNIKGQDLIYRKPVNRFYPNTEKWINYFLSRGEDATGRGVDRRSNSDARMHLGIDRMSRMPGGYKRAADEGPIDIKAEWKEACDNSGFRPEHMDQFMFADFLVDHGMQKQAADLAGKLPWFADAIALAGLLDKPLTKKAAAPNDSLEYHVDPVPGSTEAQVAAHYARGYSFVDKRAAESLAAAIESSPISRTWSTLRKPGINRVAGKDGTFQKVLWAPTTSGSNDYPCTPGQRRHTDNLEHRLVFLDGPDKGCVITYRYGCAEDSLPLFTDDAEMDKEAGALGTSVGKGINAAWNASMAPAKAVAQGVSRLWNGAPSTPPAAAAPMNPSWDKVPGAQTPHTPEYQGMLDQVDVDIEQEADRQTPPAIKRLPAPAQPLGTVPSPSIPPLPGGNSPALPAVPNPMPSALDKAPQMSAPAFDATTKGNSQEYQSSFGKKAGILTSLLTGGAQAAQGISKLKDTVQAGEAAMLHEPSGNHLPNTVKDLVSNSRLHAGMSPLPEFGHNQGADWDVPFSGAERYFPAGRTGPDSHFDKLREGADRHEIPTPDIKASMGQPDAQQFFANAEKKAASDEVPGDSTPKKGKAYIVWLPTLGKLFGEPIRIDSLESTGDVTKINFEKGSNYGETSCRIILRKDLSETCAEELAGSANGQLPRVIGSDAVWIPVEAQLSYERGMPQTAANVNYASFQPPASFQPVTLNTLDEALRNSKQASITIERNPKSGLFSLRDPKGKIRVEDYSAKRLAIKLARDLRLPAEEAIELVDLAKTQVKTAFTLLPPGYMDGIAKAFDGTVKAAVDSADKEKAAWAAPLPDGRTAEAKDGETIIFEPIKDASPDELDSLKTKGFFTRKKEKAAAPYYDHDIDPRIQFQDHDWDEDMDIPVENSGMYQDFAEARRERYTRPQQNYLDAHDPGQGRNQKFEDPNFIPDDVILKMVHPMQEMAQLGQQMGLDTLMDHGAVASMVKVYDVKPYMREYLGKLENSLDQLGRLVFMLYWKPKDFSELFGQDDIPQIENKLTGVFSSFGDIILELLQSSGEKV